MIGGISGRTSLSGEGLQHIDGQSHHYAMAFPNVMAYDPAFAYELAVIIQNGLKRLYKDDEDLIYYVTMGNQAYKMPAQPKDTDEGILKGLYRFRKSRKRKNKGKKVNLLGSGSIMTEVLEAADILENDHDIPVDVCSVTSYKALYDNARDVERQNYRNGKSEKSHLEDQLSGEGEIFIAATDFMQSGALEHCQMGAGGFYCPGYRWLRAQ
ncbi:MAG: hypothetical protein U5L96_20225 [Owenweeksia sp.]|nr:hypothetical protein [Owenweeksia sp.]